MAQVGFVGFSARQWHRRGVWASAPTHGTGGVCGAIAPTHDASGGCGAIAPTHGTGEVCEAIAHGAGVVCGALTL